MTMLVAFLKFMVGIAPDMYGTVKHALREWKELDDAKTEELIKEIEPADWGAVDKKVDNKVDSLDIPEE